MGNRSSRFHWLVLASMMAAFVAFKWHSLYLPYFWDEAWSYLPAITQMASVGPCFWPDCIHPDLYRGHPLFFYFISSAWMNISGGSLFMMHLAMVLIACLTVRACYLLSLQALQPPWALAVAALLMLQEVFFVQSSFVLPEVLLAFLFLSALYHYAKGDSLSCVLFLSAMVLTKEIGLLVALIFAVYHVIVEKDSLQRTWYMGVPLLVAALFYGSQKIVLGWFFYPLHLDLAGASWKSVYAKVTILIHFLFAEQGRGLFWLCVVMVSAFYFLRGQPIKRALMPSRMLWLAVTVSVLCLLFSAVNFIMLRYLLFLLPLFLLMGVYSVYASGAPVSWPLFVLPGLLHIACLPCMTTASINHGMMMLPSTTSIW